MIEHNLQIYVNKMFVSIFFAQEDGFRRVEIESSMMRPEKKIVNKPPKSNGIKTNGFENMDRERTFVLCNVLEHSLKSVLFVIISFVVFVEFFILN